MNHLEEIKKRLDIVEFINNYVSLKKSGRNFVAICPFHSEKTPSFVVSPERQIWHCFGACNEGGDVFKFLMKWENLSFPEAVRILAQQTGVKLKETDFTDKTWAKKQQLFTINQLAADYYQYLFEKHRLGEKARSYVKSRGVNNKISKEFGLGYSPSSWDSLSRYLNKKGYDNQLIFETGLLVKTAHNSYYDRFRGRLIFPLKDIRGNIVGFSGRSLGETKEAKYINTPETLVYHKREHLFGLDVAVQNIKKRNEIILTEGEFDVILSHQYGYNNTVAIKGSALTQDHLRLIKRLTNKIVFALDMDIAGNQAVKRGIEEAERFDFSMEVIRWEAGTDAADILSKNPSDFKKYYKNKVSIYEFLIDNSIKKNDPNNVYGKKTIVEEIVPYLANIYNPVLQDYFIKLLAKKTEVTPDAINKSLGFYKRKIKQKKLATTIPTSPKGRKRQELLEEYLIALLLQTEQQEYVFKSVAKYLQPDDFYLKATDSFINKAKEVYKQYKNLNKLADLLPPQLVDYFNRGILMQLPRENINWHKEIKKTILEIKKYSLKKKIKLNLSEETEEKKATEYMSQLKEVEKALSIL